MKLNLRVISILNFLFRMILSYLFSGFCRPLMMALEFWGKIKRTQNIKLVLRELFTFIIFILSDTKVTLRDGMVK
jgi:hypothetical protein